MKAKRGKKANLPLNTATFGYSDKMTGLLLCLDKIEPTSIQGNWEPIVNAMISDGLYGFLKFKLDEKNFRDLPPALEVKLKNISFENHIAKLKWEGYWKKIVSAFKQEGLVSVTLKGWAVARLFYPSPGLRDMTDIDFLVKITDVEEIVQCLVSLGYSPPAHWEDPAIRSYNLEQGVHVKLFKRNWPRLEVHIALAHEIAPETTQEFFDHSQDGPVPGEKIPSHSHLLFHILHHGARHRDSFKWVLDTWQILKRVDKSEHLLEEVADLALKWGAPLFVIHAAYEFELITGKDMSLIKEKLRPYLRIPEIIALNSWQKRMKNGNGRTLQIAHRISFRPITGHAGIWASLFPPPGHTVEKYGITSDQSDFWMYRIRDILRRIITFT